MNMYIRMVDNQPIDHPILEDNFKLAFPNIDTNNLPEGFARFERVPYPRLTVFQRYEGTEYRLIDGVVKDVHVITDFTEEEKAQAMQAYEDFWNNSPLKLQYPSWVFSETCGCYEPPVAYPRDGKQYNWNESNLSWEEIIIP